MPVQLTRGLSVITINTGVDVSAGRVTKAFEMIPRYMLHRVGGLYRGLYMMQFLGHTLEMFAMLTAHIALCSACQCRGRRRS